MQALTLLKRTIFYFKNPKNYRPGESNPEIGDEGPTF